MTYQNLWDIVKAYMKKWETSQTTLLYELRHLEKEAMLRCCWIKKRLDRIEWNETKDCRNDEQN